MNKNDIRFLTCNNLYLSNGLDNTVFEQTDSGYLLHLNLFDTLKLCPFLVLRTLSSIYFAKTTYYRKLSSIIKRERPRRTKIVCHSKKQSSFTHLANWRRFLCCMKLRHLSINLFMQTIIQENLHYH